MTVAQPRRAVARPRSAKTPPLRITPDTISQARRAGRAAGAAPAGPFAFPEFPPQAIPPDTTLRPRLAMDSAGGFGGTAWAGSLAGNWGGPTEGFLGYTELALLAQRPEYRNMVSTIATEATREWIEIAATDDENAQPGKPGATSDRVKELEDELGRLGIQAAFCRCAEHDGFFGRGHLYLDTGATDNPDELKKPLALDRAKIAKGAFKAVRPVEPVWVYPISYESIDPLRPDWYNPTIWYVMGKEVHASRLLRFVGHEVPDLLKPAYAFGGISLSQLAKPYVDIWLQTRQSVADLIKKFSIIWLATDLENQLSPSAGGRDFFERMEFFNLVRNNLGAMILNKGVEEIGQLAVPLSGLHELQSQAQEHMCAVSRTPAVKLLGVQPAGFNASSEGELETWRDYVHAFQERLFAPQLKTVIELAQISLWGDVDKSIAWKFKPLRQLTEAEKATIQQNKAATHKTYLEEQVVSPQEVRQALADDDESPYNALDVDDIPEQSDDLGELDVEGAAPGPENGAV